MKPFALFTILSLPATTINFKVWLWLIGVLQQPSDEVLGAGFWFSLFNYIAAYWLTYMFSEEGK
jgi:hypothetical protein